MIKQKLINKRKELGFSQPEIADKLGMEQSQYSRRENGIVQISRKEWDALTKILGTSLEEIYEPQDGIYIINNENANGNFGNYNNFHAYSEFAMEAMKKYIESLEEENKRLKSQLKSINK